MRLRNFIVNKFSAHKLFVCLSLSLIVFYGLVNLCWLKLNLYPYGPDEFNHLSISFAYYRALLTGLPVFGSACFDASGHWPPLYHIVAAFAYLPFGFSYVLAVMLNMVYFTVLLGSVYFIGQRVFDKKTAALSLVCLSFYPAVFISSRVFNPDFALMAAVALAVALLIASDGLSRGKTTLWLGIVCGLGMLVKWTFLLFMAGPFLMVVLEQATRAKADPVQDRLWRRNVIVAFVAGASMALAWYIPNAPLLVKRVEVFYWDMGHVSTQLNAQLGNMHRSESTFQFSKLFQQTLLLINEGVTLPFFLLLMAGAFLCWRERDKCWGLFLWALIPYGVLSLSYQQDIRFLLPALPALALITAGGVRHVRARALRAFLWAAVVAVGAGQFFYVSFYSADNQAPLSALVSPSGVHPFYYAARPQDGARRGPPWQEDWHFAQVAEILRAAKAPYDRRLGEDTRFVGVIAADEAPRSIAGYPFALDYFLWGKDVFDTRAVHLMVRKDRSKFLFLWPDFDAFIVISKNDPWLSPQALSINEEEFTATLKSSPELDISKDNVVISGLNPVMARGAFKLLTGFLDHRPAYLRPIGRVALARGFFAYVYLNENPRNGVDVFAANKKQAVVFFHDRAHIFYEGKKLTARNGLRMAFSVDGREYSSAGAHWALERKTDTELFVVGRWQDLPGVSAVWHFDISDEKSIKFDMRLKAIDRTALSRVEFLRVSAASDPQYTSLQTEKVSSQFYWQDAGRDVVSDLGTRFMSVSKPGFPSFMLVYDGKDEPLAQVFGHVEERKLQYTAKPEVIPLSEGGYGLSLQGRLGGSSASEIILVQDQKRAYRRQKLVDMSLNQNNLRLYFDDGKARLFVDGRELTHGPDRYRAVFGTGHTVMSNGLEMAFKNGAKEYRSCDAAWSLERKTDKDLFLVGRWQDLPGVTAKWHFAVSQDNIIKTDVILKALDRQILSCIGFVRVSVDLDPRYDFWDTEKERGRFYPKDIGKDVVSDLGTRFLSVREPGLSSFGFVYDGKDEPLAQIFGHLSERRLQYTVRPEVLPLSDGGYSLAWQGRLGGFSEASKARLLAEKKDEYSRQRAMTTLQQNTLQLYFDAGYGRIFIDGKEITQGAVEYKHVFGTESALTAKGVGAVFQIGGREYLSSDAQWAVEKRTDTALSLVGHWGDLPDVRAVWHFDVSNGKDIKFDVGLQASTKEKLSNVDYMGMTSWLRPAYTSWQTGKEQGVFQDAGNGGVILDDATTQSLSVSGRHQCPFTILLDEPANSLAQIHYSKKGRMLKYWVKPDVKALSEGGYGISLKGRVDVLSGEEGSFVVAEKCVQDTFQRMLLRKKNSLRKKKLEVFFDAGQGRVFLEGKELTMGFGMYTSVLASGVRRDSQNALWDVRRTDETTLVATGQWEGLPLRQIWTLVLKDAHTLDWTVDLEPTRELEMESVSAGLILNGDFSVIGYKPLGAEIMKSMYVQHRVSFQDYNDTSWTAAAGSVDYLSVKNVQLKYKRKTNAKLRAGRIAGYFKGRIEIK
ncbi:MAG: glycosyltransferase family 39 protein [Candidatus Omnitrophica bacterium]|nr:glycosyltransferase family 39 protein [Candidatus Omnitrophota bacterium]